MTLVRAVRADDLDGVAAIAAHYVLNSTATFAETPQTVAEWRERLGDLEGRGLPFLVAEADGEVAGYAYAGPWRPKPAYRYTVEDTIYLDPRHLGKGLGTALLGELVERAAKAGMRQMIAVIADAAGDGSVALHRRFGFVEAGRLSDVGHKQGRWISTILMQRALGPGAGA
ncbi:GNAT family N-acetyltransferase [Actinomadura nitritigenes]|uniref:N-acetyltransferase n=1 Tax=Actinomadura nitritigenes TaxID=134602 RepID=A0ABS3R6D7_9ACTN|nr:GNAT family N-acetyltransferase [Actinomadura nitritigenes]MBO2441795.1 N-acetyltransferase [Actinomadura nitritigenes]